MKTIVISDPDFLENEQEAFCRLLEEGVFRIHLRKPEASEDELAQLIEHIPQKYRQRISLHDHHILAIRYGLGGIHLNGRNPFAPQDFKGTVSRSCHSFKEVKEFRDRCDYLFLSPIFNSISKQGYEAHFSIEELQKQHEAGWIDEKVFALGGITPDKYPLLRKLGFGGGALLGHIWEPWKKGKDFLL